MESHTATTTTPTASTKTHQSISTPELERSMELFEASYFTHANSVSNVKRPAWYGTPPPTRDSPWAADG